MRALVLLGDGFGGQGGMAKFNRDFLSALCAYPNIEEVIAIPRHASEAIGMLPEKLVYRLDGRSGKISFLRAVLSSAMRRAGPVLIFCAHINFLPLAFLAAKITRSQVVVNLHGVEAWQPHPSRLVRTLLPHVAAYISVSEFTKKQFTAWSRVSADRFFILPNCVELEAYGPGPKSPELLHRYRLEGRTVLMTLARLHSAERYKGIDEVMEILPDLVKKIPSISYMICGSGDDRERLERKAETLGIADRVVFTGHLEETKKLDHFRLADGFVMAGWGEGFGIVYLEALACGIPALASKLDASREAVRDGELGTLADPKNPQELRTGILNLLAQPRGHVPSGLAYFSREKFEERVRKILNDLN